MFRGIVAQGIEEGVGHVGLETDESWPVGFLEQVHHVSPRMHAAPANLTLGSETFAVFGGNSPAFLERFGNELCVAGRILAPVFRIAGRVDADDAAGTCADFAELVSDAAGFPDCGDPAGALIGAAHGVAVKPNRCDDGADHEVLRPDLVSESLNAIVTDVDVDVRIVGEQVNAIEFHAVHFRVGGEVEHGVEVNERLGTGAAFSDEARPYGVVDLEGVLHYCRCFGEKISLTGRSLCPVVLFPTTTVSKTAETILKHGWTKWVQPPLFSRG